MKKINKEKKVLKIKKKEESFWDKLKYFKCKHGMSIIIDHFF